MILLVHMLLGAAIGSYLKSPLLAVILAFFSHYLLDVVPHNEYSLKNIIAKNWKNSRFDIFKITLDFCTGILLILIFSKNSALIYACAFMALLPDALTILEFIFPNKILKTHSRLHIEIIHFLKHKKIPAFWRILSQATIIVASIIFLLVK
jgi:hypothetical protein